jgi:hypothetical protein
MKEEGCQVLGSKRRIAGSDLQPLAGGREGARIGRIVLGEVDDDGQVVAVLGFESGRRGLKARHVGGDAWRRWSRSVHEL